MVATAISCSQNRQYYYNHLYTFGDEVTEIDSGLCLKMDNDSMHFYFVGYSTMRYMSKFYVNRKISRGIISYRRDNYESPKEINRLYLKKDNDSILVTDIPFYIYPYKDYYWDLSIDQKGSGKIYAKNLGRKDFTFNGTDIETYMVVFNYYDFRFSAFKPDTVYFEKKTLVPICVKYKAIYDNFYLYEENYMDYIYNYQYLLDPTR